MATGMEAYKKQRELQQRQQEQQMQQIKQMQEQQQQQKQQMQQQAAERRQQQQEQAAARQAAARQAAAKQPAQQTTATQGNAQTQAPSVNTYERPATAAYTPSQAVLDAQTALQNLQTTKPQGYTNKYQPQMEALLNQIQNPEKFKWDFNGDELFKSYADLYTQNGKQASMDAMGQAAALTGGYGNSYAQQVGNQAYDEYLRALYDKGFELRDKAYEQYLNDRQDLYNQYGLLNDAEAQDYARYNDLMNYWLNDRGYYTDQYNTLSQQDYNRYADARDFAEQQYQYDMNMHENIRQFNESLNWDKMSAQQKYAAEYAMQILANGQMPSEELLQAAGLSAADAQKMMAQIEATTGGTSGVSNGNTYYVDKFGKYYTYDKNGNARSVNESDIKDSDYIDKTENTGTKGAQAEINDKYRKENDKLKNHYKNSK